MLKIKKTDNPIAIRSQRLICESFLKIMYQKPYEKITITEVCKDAKLVRETFYRNFSSKEAVIKQIIDSKYEELNELNKYNDKYHDIQEISLNYFTYWKEQKDFLNLLIDNHLFSIMLNKTIELIYLKIDKNIGEDETEITKKYIASIYSGAIDNLLFSWVKNDFKGTPMEMTRILKYYSNLIKKSNN